MNISLRWENVTSFNFSIGADGRERQRGEDTNNSRYANNDERMNWKEKINTFTLVTLSQGL
jgi:hypothetical protein